MVEYEYSFKVKDIFPYIEYCKKNNYKKISEGNQTRILYRNDNKILARLTTDKCNGNIKTFLDFKDENNSDEILKVSKETIPLVVTDENKESVMSILKILKYKKDKVLKRKRYVYINGDVTFELDEYISPEKMCVVAIEGKKEEVDKVYLDIKERLET